MEATIALVLLLGLVFGGMMLMLASGFISTERERARQAEERRAEEATPPVQASTPVFLFSPRPVVPEAPFVFDDVLISRLENHVRLEQAVVAQFVNQPSIDTLYHQTGSSFHIH